MHYYEAKMSVMRVASGMPATSKMEFFVTIDKDWNFTRSSSSRLIINRLILKVLQFDITSWQCQINTKTTLFTSTLELKMLNDVESRMFYLTGWSKHICSIAPTLLLIVVFDFQPSQVSYMVQKGFCSLSTKVNKPFYDTVRISVIIV